MTINMQQTCNIVVNNSIWKANDRNSDVILSLHVQCTCTGTVYISASNPSTCRVYIHVYCLQGNVHPCFTSIDYKKT